MVNLRYRERQQLKPFNVLFLAIFIMTVSSLLHLITFGVETTGKKVFMSPSICQTPHVNLPLSQ